jgi:hypothetical protein
MHAKANYMVQSQAHPHPLLLFSLNNHNYFSVVEAGKSKMKVLKKFW